jgi:hypothetical protein
MRPCLSVAHVSALGSRLSALNENVRPAGPARYAVLANQIGVPGRSGVAHLEVKNAVQGEGGGVRMEANLDRLKPKILPHLFQEGLEVVDSLTPS